MSVPRQTSGGRSPPVAEFHRKASLTLEDAPAGWNDPSGLRSSGFHCAIGGPRAKTRVKLTRYHGVLAPNHRWRGEVTPAKRGKGATRIANTDVHSHAEPHVTMPWPQRLKRVFNIEIEVCGHCGGSVKIIACIADQDVIDRILAHLREKEQGRPTLSHLVPPTRERPRPLPLFTGRKSAASNQPGRY